jgi:hypothetical protein
LWLSWGSHLWLEYAATHIFSLVDNISDSYSPFFTSSYIALSLLAVCIAIYVQRKLHFKMQ